MGHKKNQAGQTLIETMVAAFILSMGITAALGLAVFAYGNSQGIVRNIIATGLAREGIEAVKNMRDTNWLKDSLDLNCYNFQDGTNNSKCYKKWQKASGGWYDIDVPNGLGSQSFVLKYNPDFSDKYQMWNLRQENSNYGLDFDATGAKGYYYFSNPPNTFSNATSFFARQIILEEDSSSPFNHNDIGPKLKITSRVWWADKNCPKSNTWNPNQKCGVEIISFLTNWKNY